MKIHHAAALLCFELLLPGMAFAGTLYGTVRLGNQAAPQLRVEVVCPGFDRPGRPAVSATTDGNGSYTMRVAERGRCEMRIGRNDARGLPFTVFVSDSPVRYDVEINARLAKVR